MAVTLGAVTMRVLAVLVALARLTMIVLAAVTVTGVRTMRLAVTALAGGAVVGVTVSDEVMNRLNQEAATVQNLEPIELTPATRAALTSLLIDYQLTGVMQMNPTVAAQVNQVMNEASSSSTATLNPRFPVSSVKAEPTLFGDAVSGEKDPDVSSLMGGGTPGTTTR